MADEGVLIGVDSIPLIQQAIDATRRNNPFGGTSTENQPFGNFSPLRGYLMQSVSQGEDALCQIFKYNPAYICWKIDLAGVIYLNHTDGDSRFQLRLTVNADTFDTEILSVEGLTIEILCAAIATASNGLFSQSDMVGALGHPTKHQYIVNNSDLYPPLSDDYKVGDLIDSNIGCWIFGIKSYKIDDRDFDIDLLFSFGEEPVQLNGPAVMTLQRISDCPTNEVRVATDMMDLVQPTPLRGGTKVILLPFDDVGGYGIVAANPREYLFRLDFDPDVA